MKTVLNVGDRVRLEGYKFRDEPTRMGEVVEIYKGTPNGLGGYEEFVAIKWDHSGETERGFLRKSSRLQRYTPIVPVEG